VLCVVCLHEMKAYLASDAIALTFRFACVVVFFLYFLIRVFPVFLFTLCFVLSRSFQSSCKVATFSISYSKVYNFVCLLGNNDKRRVIWLWVWQLFVAIGLSDYESSVLCVYCALLFFSFLCWYSYFVCLLFTCYYPIG